MKSLIRKVPVILLMGSFLVLGCATSGFMDSQEDKNELAQKKFREALQFGSLNQKSKMQKALNEAIELNPNDENFHLYLGKIYLQEGDTDKAESEFLKSIQINNRFKDAYQPLAQINMQKQDWKKAIQYFNKDLSISGTQNPQQVYNWLALCHYSIGEIDQAEMEWEKALSIKDNAAIRLNLGLAYIDGSKFELAKDSLEKAIKLKPRFAQAHFELAQLYIKENKKEKAKEHLNKAILYSRNSKYAKQSKEYLERINQEN